MSNGAGTDSGEEGKTSWEQSREAAVDHPQGTTVDHREDGSDVHPVVDRFGPVGRRLAVMAAVLGLFALALAVSRTVVGLATATATVGEPGTIPRLLVSVAGLQVVGFGIGAALVLATCERPLAYLRVGPLDQQSVLHGTFVGLVLMLLTVAATLAFQLLDIAPAEAAVGAARDPVFYLVLFFVSTVVVVPMEELFFRGIVQRSLADVWHPAVAIGVASLLFMSIHTSVTVGTGGETLALALFLAFGVALGVSYHLTENLLVPVIGHALFNGAQILTRAVDVAV